MTDKIYYQQAASELEAGQIDQALWVKVEAEHPEASKTVQRAIYIKLRAQELATERLRQIPIKALQAEGLRKLVPRRPWHWLIYAIVVYFAWGAATLIAGDLGIAVLPLGIVGGIVIARSNPSDLPPIEWSGWLMWLAEITMLALLWAALLGPTTSNALYWLGTAVIPFGVLSVPGILIAFGTHFRRPVLALGVTLAWAVLAFMVVFIGHTATSHQLPAP